jgi:Right handed beta helix region
MSRYLLTVVLVFVAATGTAQAATLYVSPSGSDSNAGTSTAAPWRTVSRVNNAALQPGDVVSFEAGATFSDATLMPQSSGTAASRITFNSYGSGRATLSYPQGAVWLAPGRNYLTFQGLDLTTGGGAYTVFADSNAPGSAYITIRDCVIRNGAATGIGSWQTTDAGWRIENNTITHTGDSAIILLGNGAVVDGNRIRPSRSASTERGSTATRSTTRRTRSGSSTTTPRRRLRARPTCTTTKCGT